jgi:hypothetical protein
MTIVLPTVRYVKGSNYFIQQKQVIYMTDAKFKTEELNTS